MLWFIVMRQAMKLIRYNDLVAKGVVNSRMTLKRLIDTQGFPLAS